MKPQQNIHQLATAMGDYPHLSALSVVLTAVSSLMSKAKIKHPLCVVRYVWRARSDRGRWLGVKH